MNDDLPAFRIPPRNLEAEQALLGAILVNNTAYWRVATFLRPQHFADPIHGEIYAACAKLIEANRLAEPLALKHVFETHPGFQPSEDGKTPDMAVYIARLARAAVTVINTGEYGRVIYDLHRRRLLIEMARGLVDDAYDTREGDAETLSQRTLGQIEEMLRQGGPTLRTGREVRMARVEEMAQPSLIYSTGFRRLDAVMGGGFYPRKAYGIVARRKAGKTMMAGAISDALDKRGVSHLYCAAEMGADEIEDRAHAHDLGVNALAFRDPAWRANNDFLDRAAEFAVYASDHKIYADIPGISFDAFKSMISAAIVRHKIKGFIVDYLQLVGAQRKGQNRAEYLDEVTQWIAETVRVRNVWALVLAQENQEGNVRGGEGMLLAFDQVFKQNRVERGDGLDDGIWLETMATRYTRWGNVGNESDPAFILNSRKGPFIEEVRDDSAQGELID